jgi:Protein of unknown function (DUF2628)
VSKREYESIMPTYTVHAPPPRQGESADPERFVFVRDGFYFWAFLLTPFWLLARRLWLVFVLYVVFSILLGVALKLIGAGPLVGLLVGLAVALLMGLEAATLRRWSFALRGWQMLGFVVGEDKETAERRFFGEWVQRATTPPPLPGPTYAAPVRRGPPTGTDVIGLFPEPGGAP